MRNAIFGLLCRRLKFKNAKYEKFFRDFEVGGKTLYRFIQVPWKEMPRAINQTFFSNPTSSSEYFKYFLSSLKYPVFTYGSRTCRVAAVTAGKQTGVAP